MEEKWRIIGMRLSSDRFSMMTAAFVVEMTELDCEAEGEEDEEASFVIL